AQGFGYTDTKEKRPATPETVYRIGSISKLFTVMATMQLAEQGKIDIDGEKGLSFWGYKMKMQ
ncbi:MAG: beta-lactamase family protein, partial [Deltaproteobacteria bacterium]|nr:beta-lactamase family protein [Deltaproteobacteria bacterium]